MATKSIRYPNRQRDKLMTLMKERASDEEEDDGNGGLGFQDDEEESKG